MEGDLVLKRDLGKWQVRADTGGTFTDGWAQSPEGEEFRCKVLSSGCVRIEVSKERGGKRIQIPGLGNYGDHFFTQWLLNGIEILAHEGDCITLKSPLSLLDGVAELRTGEEAPVVAARLLTRTGLGDSFPPMDFRVATTRGTNALLEGTGVEPVLFVTQGFGDLPSIRDQRRPALFARVIEKQDPVTKKVVEVIGRISAEGEILIPLDEKALRSAAREWRSQGERVAVVALLHADRFSEMEYRVQTVLREEGFEDVTISSGLGGRLGFLPRMETALGNGYLGPIMNAFKERVSRVGEVSFLTSAGGLQEAASYEPVDSLLSGPAGGLVGALAVARAAGFERVLTFDMGGTSTDVARLEGMIPLRYEQSIGPLQVRRPGVRLETVAAGGGSVCRWYQGGLEVGPQSAGADPGPACYGRGGPLTVTDVNFLLGHLEAERVEIPLFRKEAELRLEELKQAMKNDGASVPADRELLEGLRAIAIERMAAAMRSISVGEGFEPKDYTLVAFGGAGPQHACELAESLGMSRVLVPGDAGLLSAWGLHRSRREGVAERQVLVEFSDLVSDWGGLLEELKEEAEGQVDGSELENWLIEVRVVKQAANLELTFDGSLFPTLPELRAQFVQRYHEVFGYSPPQGHSLELVMVRGVARERERESEEEHFLESEGLTGFAGSEYCTVLVAQGWKVRLGSLGSLLLEQEVVVTADSMQTGVVGEELMRARFESVADGMGELLRRTALSTNVKERLDFSCALLDGEGRLLVNAPHIPVHLGALGVCVRRVSEQRVWQRGDVVVVNHPGFGGSHLPDVTVVSPVFGQEGVIAFVANRAHHAEIGGKAPGSMPGDATCLEEEGVVLPPMLIVSAGEERYSEVEDCLRGAKYPSRAVEENLADLKAQVAANRMGVIALEAMAKRGGDEWLQGGMGALFTRADQLMVRRLQQEGEWKAKDALDDGTAVEVFLRGREGRLEVDFAGSAPSHPGNLNATAGVTRSAVLYALRLWLDEDLPLNEGLLERVDIRAEGSFLSPEFSKDPGACPAVVGGNVETSQRIVEVILRALGVGAESQGTMNNLLFGNDSFGYYETIGGGSGATSCAEGASGVHVHMTNTAITDPEVLEYRFPVRLWEFSLRGGSGGGGLFPGGDGLVREIEFLQEMTVTVLTQRRDVAPRGFGEGENGKMGQQFLLKNGSAESLSGVTTFLAKKEQRIRIETPGGGGWAEENPSGISSE